MPVLRLLFLLSLPISFSFYLIYSVYSRLEREERNKLVFYFSLETLSFTVKLNYLGYLGLSAAAFS